MDSQTCVETGFHPIFKHFKGLQSDHEPEQIMGLKGFANNSRKECSSCIVGFVYLRSLQLGCVKCKGLMHGPCGTL